MEDWFMPQPAYSPPPRFWQDFASQYWERSPTSFRYPATEPLMTEDEALAIFRGLGDRFRSGEQADIDLYVENALLKSDIGRHLPADADRNLTAYQARVTDQLGGRRFSLVTNRGKGQSREHGSRVTDFT